METNIQDVRKRDRFEILVDYADLQKGQIFVVEFVSLTWFRVRSGAEEQCWSKDSELVDPTSGLTRRLPRETEPASSPSLTIEQRRAALKPGDQVMDPELVYPGIVVTLGRGPLQRLTVLGPRKEIEGMPDLAPGWNVRTPGGVEWTLFRADCEAGSVRLVAHAPGQATVYPFLEDAPGPKMICDAVQCDLGTSPHDCIRAKHRRSYSVDKVKVTYSIGTQHGATWGADPLPAGWIHEAPPVCLSSCTPVTPCRSVTACPALREDAIAASMREREKRVQPVPVSVERVAYEPQRSGLGGMVGRYRYGR